MNDDQLDRQGFAGPIPVFSPSECARLLATLWEEPGEPPAWGKGWAAASPAWHRIATDPRILALVVPRLGPDVVLWGASLVVKADNDVHPFHTDIESMAPEGGFLTVWIGLENTDRSSGLKFVPGSHRYGTTIQEMNYRAGIPRADSTDETTLAAAREFDPAAEIVQPGVGDGEALVFDGRIWHGSHNTTRAERTALLVQFARADRPVRMPRRYDWPVEFRSSWPPVVRVAGRADRAVNRIVRGPDLGGAVGNGVYPLPLLPETIERFTSWPHLSGRTPRLDSVETHSSILPPGASPHPLHSHIEEEILVVVAGEAELHVAMDGQGTGLERRRMGPGDFAYYSAFQHHTLVNTGAGPVLYWMIKWANPGKREDQRAAGRAFVQAGALLQEATRLGRPLFDLRTRWLKRLHAHVSMLEPGAGYPPHADPYDVAILLLEGSVATLGRTVTAPALLFHPAGEPHGIEALGEVPVRYLVFEFDDSRAPLSLVARAGRRLAARVRTWLPR